MVTTINWSTDTTDIIDKIRDTIGRDILINTTVSGTACTVSGCVYDPITGLSTNPFCPTCGGDYWINTISGYIVKAHVRPGQGDIPIWTPGGFIVEGDVSVQIKYTVANVGAVNSADHYVVDGKTYLQDRVSYRGVPDINRIVITLKEQEG